MPSPMRQSSGLLFCSMLMFSVASCAQPYIPDARVLPYDLSGRIVDADTGHPIEGAVIVANWNMYRPGLAPFVNAKFGLLNVAEATTDRDGRFFIPNLGRDEPPPGWRREPGSFPWVMVFKAGYAVRYGNPNPWPAGIDFYGKPLAAPAIAARYPNEPGIVMALYEYSKDPEVMRGADRTRLGLAKSAAWHLKHIIDRADLSHSSAEAADVIQRQIHALVAVADEIELFTGKKFGWGDGGQINRAIEQARIDGGRR